MIRVGRVIRRVLNVVGLDINRVPRSTEPFVWVPKYMCPNGPKLIDFRKDEQFGQVAQEAIGIGRTLLAENRLYTLWSALQNTITLEGDIVEVGSFRGGTARFLRQAEAVLSRQSVIHVMDTFRGHLNVDRSVDGSQRPGYFQETDEADVRRFLADLSGFEFHVGEFPGTASEVGNCRFRLIHLDVDLHAPTIAALEFFWPRLTVGGAIVVDDYGFTTTPGVRRAVDAFVQRSTGVHCWYMHTGQVVLSKTAA